jgi:hypothetical protein
MFVTELALIFLTFIVKKIMMSKAKMAADEKINKKTAKVYRGS